MELDGVAFAERRYSWGKIDVVGNQDCLARTQTDYESLVTPALVVIRENLDNSPLALNLNTAGMTDEGLREY